MLTDTTPLDQVPEVVDFGLNSACTVFHDVDERTLQYMYRIDVTSPTLREWITCLVSHDYPYDSGDPFSFSLEDSHEIMEELDDIFSRSPLPVYAGPAIEDIIEIFYDTHIDDIPTSTWGKYVEIVVSPLTEFLEDKFEDNMN